MYERCSSPAIPNVEESRISLKKGKKDFITLSLMEEAALKVNGIHPHLSCNILYNVSPNIIT